jgi:hypothetical protein
MLRKDQFSKEFGDFKFQSGALCGKSRGVLLLPTVREPGDIYQVIKTVQFAVTVQNPKFIGDATNPMFLNGEFMEWLEGAPIRLLTDLKCLQ